MLLLLPLLVLVHVLIHLLVLQPLLVSFLPQLQMKISTCITPGETLHASSARDHLI